MSTQEPSHRWAQLQWIELGVPSWIDHDGFQCGGAPPNALERPPKVGVRLEVTEAVEARLALEAIKTAPAGASVAVPGSTVTNDGSWSHSDDKFGAALETLKQTLKAWTRNCRGPLA